MGNSINKSIMQQVFLEDLLKGKYIDPIEKYIWDRFVINHEGKYYLVNYEIEKVINEAFIFLLQRNSIWSRYNLKETIKEQMKICEVGKEHKIKLLNDLIKRERRVLKKCIGQIFSGNTIESTRESWRQYLSKDGIFLVHHLVFDVTRQDMKQLPVIINIFKENYLPNFQELDKEKMQREIDKFQVTPIPAAIEWVEHDFFSGNLEKITTCTEIGENISYLKKLIYHYENGESLPAPKELIATFTLSEIKTLENKFWKAMEMEIVINHFKVFTERKNKNGVPFLSPAQFISFLRKGFLADQNQEQQKINCGTGEKGFIILRFYEFYDLSVTHYMHPNKKDKFIKLFTDCFNNWDSKTIPPFFKNNKTREKWQ